jgi:replicative DNA helicase
VSNWVEPGISPAYPENVAAAEKALVSFALFDPDSALAVNLPARSFFNIRLREVWQATIAVYERTGTADPVTVSDALQAAGTLDAVGGLAYLSNCFIGAHNYGGASLAPHHAEVVRTAYNSRELRRLASEIPHALDAGAGLPELLDRVRTFIDTVETSGAEGNCTVLEDEVGLVTARVEEIQAQRAAGNYVQTGLVTGLGLERYVPGGIPCDKLTMLFGETGTFKTAVKQWIADQVALSGRYVLDFSIEDSAELTAQRFLARHSGIPYGRIVTGDVTPAEAKLLAELTPRVREASQRVIVVGNVPGTIDEAVRLARYWARKVDLAAVFVDYIQLMEMDLRGNEAQELYRVCVTAQRAAHRDKIAWVLLSQMNRKHEAREDKRPQLGDMYGSSAMQQACKLAIGIYRPFKHEPEPAPDSPWHGYYTNAPNGRAAYRGAIELHIRKNVLGESDVMVPVLVDTPTGRFREVKL